MITKRKKVLRWVLLFMWIALIFVMSQQPGDISSSQSDFVVSLISFTGIELDNQYMSIATLIVRKSAHFTEYFILYILAYKVIIIYTSKGVAKIIAVLFVFGYACSDEFHQCFIEGRKGAFKDVMIDTSGGIMGSFLTMAWERIKLGSKKST